MTLPREEMLSSRELHAALDQYCARYREPMSDAITVADLRREADTVVAEARRCSLDSQQLVPLFRAAWKDCFHVTGEMRLEDQQSYFRGLAWLLEQYFSDDVGGRLTRG